MDTINVLLELPAGRDGMVTSGLLVPRVGTCTITSNITSCHASSHVVGVKDLPSDRAADELHHILGQGSRLVREDILDLSQLLVQTCGTGHEARVGLLVVHSPVHVQEVALDDLDELKGHIQGDGDELVQQNDEANGLHHNVDEGWVKGRPLVLALHVPVSSELGKGAVGDDSKDDGNNPKEGEDSSNEDVHVPLKLRDLVGSLCHVEQNF